VVVVAAVGVVATLRRPGARQAAAAGPARATATAAESLPGSDMARPGPRARPVAPRAAADRAEPAAASANRVTRYARTWVNVRDGRAQATPSVRVLTPGEQVLVDSLKGGWYRVLAQGRTLGYVHRSNLEAGPPGARP
jgi:hypothetical protein